MRTNSWTLLAFTGLLLGAVVTAQQPTTAKDNDRQTTSSDSAAKPEDTEVWKPVPKVVTP